MRLKPRDRDIVWETVDGELLLIDLLHGVYFSAQGGSTQLVADLLHGYTAQECADRWNERFAQQPVALETVNAQASYLLEKGLAVSGAGAPVEAGPLFEVTDFRFPELECYEDMKEIFEMDPIHEGDLEQGWPVRV